MGMIHQINQLLALWVVLAIAAGLLFPAFTLLEPLALPLLAGIVGGVAATLDVRGFRRASTRTTGPYLVAHALMIPLAWGIGHLMGLPPALHAGLVLLGASTPDLTAPLLSRLAKGDTHQTIVLLVVTGLMSIALIPLASRSLIDPLHQVPLTDVVVVLVAGVLLPSLLGVLLHHRVIRHRPQHTQPMVLVSTVATVLITALVAALNRDLLLDAPIQLLLAALVAAVLLFAAGLMLGALSARTAKTPLRDCLFIPGTREYGLAAALVLTTGLPPAAAVIPLVFGGIQMTMAPILATRLARHPVQRGAGPTE
jgi:bile acid:Na+ symporter, BASS family